MEKRRKGETEEWKKRKTGKLEFGKEHNILNCHEMNLVAIHLSVINHQSSVSGDYALRDEVLSQIPQIKKIPDSEISA